MASVPCTLVASNSLLGIYYEGSSGPSVTMAFVNAAAAQSRVTSPIAGGATSYVIVDGSNTQVGSGTCLSTDTSISFTAPNVPGYYTVKTNNGTNGVIVGNFVVCNSPTNLYNPGGTLPNPQALAAWMPGTLDRDYYGYSPTAGTPGQGSNSPSTIATNRGADPYFTGVQDSARPRKLWLATSGQPSTFTTVASGSNGVNVSTFTGSGTLDVASATSYPAGGGHVLVQTSAGYADISFTGTGTGTLTGCTLVSGSGTLSTGGTVALMYPAPADWANLASTLKTDGYTGCSYELPCNEPDGEGWSMAQIIAYWNLAAVAILAVDSTANLLGWCSAGIYSISQPSAIGTFLAGISHTCAGITVHMENSHMNMSNIVALRQYLGGVKSELSTAGQPNLPVWLTETGINGGLYGVLQPRRDARQRTVLRFVAESYGFAKEQCNDWPIWDHAGSGLGTYLVDHDWLDSYGNLRAGIYALHVLAEALYGTSCSPTSIPTNLSFGPSGGMADSLFAGLHYTGTSNDVVVLATNGIGPSQNASVILQASAAPTACWDGWGSARTVTATGSHYSVPVDDLLTYVFFPSGTTISVVDTDQGAVAMSSAVNIALNQQLTDSSSAPVQGVVNNGSFAENNSGIAGVSAPYASTTVPQSLTYTAASPRSVVGYAVMAPGEPWQNAGWCFLSLSVTLDGTTVDTFSPGFSSEATPSASNLNSSDPCTRTSWWSGDFARVVNLAKSGTAFKLTASGSYGGEPDAAANLNTTSSNLGVTPPQQNVNQQVQIVEFQVYQTGPTPTTGGGAPVIAEL